jgi:hypothetical protein
MSAITVTAANVRPLEGAVLRRYAAGGSGSKGDVVYVASDGDVEVTDADSAGTSNGVGIVVGVSDEGVTTFVAGDAVTVCVYGPVGGFTLATPGAVSYVSGTAGKLDTAAGSTLKRMGYNESATVFFVDPGQVGLGS